jgi:regulator of protease activity HflC (stomatin/prohibitin superfamily)
LNPSAKLAIAALLSLSSTGCSKLVPVGYEGVKVNQWGGNRGVQDYTIRTGRVFFNPMTEDIFTYPIFLQTYEFTEDKRETSPTNEAITFSSREGEEVRADIGMGIIIPPGRAPYLLQRYRHDAYAIVHGPIRNQLKDEFIRFSRTMGVMEIMGPKSSDLIDSVTVAMRKHSWSSGDSVHIEYISFLNRPRVAPGVEESIRAAITATQEAIKAQNMIVKSRAEAEQLVATARGDSLSRLIRAQGEANATIALADGQAKANDRLNASLTERVLEWKKLNQWDGKQPLVVGGGAIPMIQMK